MLVKGGPGVCNSRIWTTRENLVGAEFCAVGLFLDKVHAYVLRDDFGNNY